MAGWPCQGLAALQRPDALVAWLCAREPSSLLTNLTRRPLGGATLAPAPILRVRSIEYIHPLQNVHP